MSRFLHFFLGLGLACGLLAVGYADDIAGLYLDDNFAAYEAPLANALGGDSLALPGAPAGFALDPAAKALERGDWLRAYREANVAAEATDPVLAARGKARGAWILARLGLPHRAIGRVNEALPEPAARGEVMLARAWMLWQVGIFKLADEQFELALAANPAPPAWAVAEWKQLRAARAKAAEAFSAREEPADVESPEFLDYADLARAAGAANAAASLYSQALNMLQQQQAAEPGAPRGKLVRTVNGIREAVLAAVGGKLPAAEAPAMRRVVLLTARQVALEAQERAAWESYFQLLAASLVDRGQLDYTEFDLATDLARAERDPGVGPAWREQLRPLLSDPRLRYASRVQQALARVEQHPAFGLGSAVADPAALGELVELIGREETVLAGLRGTVPADAAPLKSETWFTQVAAVSRLRLALAREDRATAEAQLALLPAGVDERIDASAFRAVLVQQGRQELREALAQLAQYPALGEAPEAAWQRVGESARSADARLRKQLGAALARPERLGRDDLEEMARVLEAQTLAAVHGGSVLEAEDKLQHLESWCRSLPGYARLPAVRVAVRDMEPANETYTAEEEEIADAIEADFLEPEDADRLCVMIAKEPYRLSPRLLLAQLYWDGCEDHRAREVINELRQRIRVNETLPIELNGLESAHDTVLICNALVAEVRATPPERRAAAAREAEKKLGPRLQSYQHILNGGKPILPDTDLGPAVVPWRHMLATVGCMQAWQGNIRQPMQMLKLVSQDTEKMLRGVVADVPFRNDLPSEAHVKAWRELLAERELSSAELMAIHEIFRPYYTNSLTGGLALAVLRVRAAQWTKAKATLAMLRQSYGVNRAYSAQLAELEQAVDRQSRDLLLFDSSLPARSEHEQLRNQLETYVAMNRDVLAEVYSRDGSSAETRYVESLEKRIEELRQSVNAADSRNDAKVNADRAEKARARSEALANLRRLTL